MKNFIGQRHNKTLVDTWCKKNMFPRFMVITGAVGSGKTLMADYICSSISAYKVVCNIDVDNVREVIKNSYSLIKPCIYVFLNAHKMSTQAKNALLKVTEEPPNKAYFILTSVSMELLLPTLKSRCVEIKMDRYSEKDLLDCGIDKKLLPYINVPGQAENVTIEDMKNMVEICDTFLANLNNLDGSILALCNKISFKDGQDGYNLDIIFNILRIRCWEVVFGNRQGEFALDYSTPYTQLNYNVSKYVKVINLISDTQHLINTTNVSKLSAFDVMLFKLSDVYNK